MFTAGARSAVLGPGSTVSDRRFTLALRDPQNDAGGASGAGVR